MKTFETIQPIGIASSMSSAKTSRIDVGRVTPAARITRPKPTPIHVASIGAPSRWIMKPSKPKPIGAAHANWRS